MNINKYPEIKPGTKNIKKLYVAIMLWIVGKAIAVAAKVDKQVKKEFAELPDNFIFVLRLLPERSHPANMLAKIIPPAIQELGLMPLGTQMIVGRDKKGKVKYMGSNPKGKKITLKMNFRNIEAAMKVFTFQESTCTAYAHDRFMVEGDLPNSLAVVRILDIVEVYLLPKLITSLAVKRYPKWSEMSPLRKYINRVVIYVRAFTF
jgi:aldehyde:ferredoxin oxidoreductase